MTEREGGGGKDLPVAADRLRRQFPDLTDEDLQAYQEVTRRLLADPKQRAQVVREVMEEAARAAEKEQAGKPLSDSEIQSLRYRRALAKMQKSTLPGPT